MNEPQPNTPDLSTPHLPEAGDNGAALIKPRRRLRLRRRRRERDEVAREKRRLRRRRRGRRAYIRSVYSLPSLATLGNAICGFGSMYVATLDAPAPGMALADPLSNFFAHYHFVAAAYLIFVAMVFDALDGRLARFARHTTDFGGQLDSLADVLSFGAAPAFLALQVFHDTLSATGNHPGPFLGRLVWSISALYMSCAAIRLARFNVSNDHGEHHHFSFLGLPSPGAGAAVAAFILMQQDLGEQSWSFARNLWLACTWLIPVVVLVTCLLMVSNIRYPHLVNRYLRGRRSIGRLLLVVATALLLVTAHRYTLGIGTLAYVFLGLIGSGFWRARARPRKAPQ